MTPDSEAGWAGAHARGRSRSLLRHVAAFALALLLTVVAPAAAAAPRLTTAPHTDTISPGSTIVFGGYGSTPLNDTWAYTYGAVALSAPSAPLSLHAAVEPLPNGSDRITLTWQPPASDGGYSITGYRMYRGTASESETILATLGNTLSYADTNVTTGTTYYYEVSAVNALGESPRSSEVSISAHDFTNPVVVFTSPIEGATLTSTVITAQGTAWDDVGVQQVEVSVNNGTWTPATGTTSWSASCTLQTGSNLILARATDPAGNVGIGGVNVTVTAGAALHTTALANAWVDLRPPAAPSPRYRSLLASDTRTGRVILFGGWDGAGLGGALNDTWSYDPATNRWTNRSPATHPDLSRPDCGVCFGTASMVYDSVANRVILFGAVQFPFGLPNQTWAYDPDANTWTRMHPASNPGYGHDFGLVYDAAADRVLYFGGGSITPHYYDIGSNRTWSYDYANDRWTDRAPAVSPPIRYGAGMAYDSKADRTLLFGGCTNGVDLWPGCAVANDTWSYDYRTNTWTNRRPVSNPPAGVDLSLVYDTQADRLILFGRGRDAGNATWSYDYTTNAWVNQRPANAPPARAGAGLVYVSVEASGSGGPGGHPSGSTLDVVGIGALVAVSGIAGAAWIVLVWTSQRKREPGPPR